jgi:hypothetical protein
MSSIDSGGHPTDPTRNRAMTAPTPALRPRTRLPRPIWITAAVAAGLWLAVGIAVTVLQAGRPPVLAVLGGVTNIGGGLVVAAIALAGSRPRPAVRPSLDRAALRAAPALVPIATAAAQAVIDGHYGIATTGAADTVILVILAVYLTAVLARGPREPESSPAK